MTTSSEDVLLSVTHVRYKKGDGTLLLMEQRLAQKISPVGKPKVQLQVVLHSGECSTFHFVNPSGADAQAKDRDQVKMMLQNLLPKFKPQIINSTSDAQESIRRLSYIEGVSGAFLADIQPQTDGCNGLKYNLTQDIIDAIFKTYPAVRKKHVDYDLFGECAKLDDRAIADAMKHTTLDLTVSRRRILRDNHH
ncbi:General transcription factor IIH subunit 1, partial [Operophtera brumata]